MQFVTNGPDIPDELLVAHEEGRVIFFCGAGISYPAGLKGFGGLVKDIYSHIGSIPDTLEQKTIALRQYDTTLALLERRTAGQKLAVRKALAASLQPNLTLPDATKTHEALLTLSRNNAGKMRLVTTNFDRLFNVAAPMLGLTTTNYSAPMLPVPKASRWDGVVYLHGHLSVTPTEDELYRLVVTSGDFGNAYLVERWAARFVSELLRRYIVCFVGYSIDDPVLRYMLDALAADRLVGEKPLDAWAFASHTTGNKDETCKEWKAKGVTPILYKADMEDHSLFHNTLHTWAKTFKDGVMGKSTLVVNHALAKPAASTQEDNFVGRMLWALSDPSGHPAKSFAEFNPAPALEWLFDAFEVRQFTWSDLRRFGVEAMGSKDEELKFSLTQRPAPYRLSPWMSLVVDKYNQVSHDQVLVEINRWLTRHLGDPRLLLWLSRKGGLMHPVLKSSIQDALIKIETLRIGGKVTELKTLKAQAPNCIPSELLTQLWRIALSDRISGPQRDLISYNWKRRAHTEGLHIALMMELPKLLSPKLKLSEKRELLSKTAPSEPNKLSDYFEWSLIPTAENVADITQYIRKHPNGPSVLRELLPDATQALKSALSLLSILGELDGKNDLSFLELQSVEPHPQNRHQHDWLELINLCRECWDAVNAWEPQRAAEIAQSWYSIQFTPFKRLALYAAAKCHDVANETWLQWLLQEPNALLWQVAARREVIRLMVERAPHASDALQQTLQEAILSPPEGELRTPENEHRVWLRLAKLQEAGVRLSETAEQFMAELKKKHPELRLRSGDRDEFHIWISSSSDPDFYTQVDRLEIPDQVDDLVAYLKENVTATPYSASVEAWGELSARRPAHHLKALCEAEKKGIWPTAHWQSSIYAWSSRKHLAALGRHLMNALQILDNVNLAEIARSVCWFIDAYAKHSRWDVPLLMEMAHRLVHLEIEEEDEHLASSVNIAINNSIGILTKAVISAWLESKPKDGTLLPNEVADFFSTICTTVRPAYIHGQVMLATYLLPLFRCDPRWTVENLMPLFQFENDEARAITLWNSYMWSPRYSLSLLEHISSSLLNALERYEQLDNTGKQIAPLSAYISLEHPHVLPLDRLRQSIGSLPEEGLVAVVEALQQSLTSAKANRPEYLKNRIKVFWDNYWPKDQNRVTSQISEELALLVLSAGEAANDALEMLAYWLIPVRDAYRLAAHLSENTAISDALRSDLVADVLTRTIDENTQFRTELAPVLRQLGEKQPDLRGTEAFIRLERLTGA